MGERDIEAPPIHNVILWDSPSRHRHFTGFGMLNDAQAVLALVCLRTQTKIKVRLDPKL